MHYSLTAQSMRGGLASGLLTLCGLAAAAAPAWTQPNLPSGNTVGLFHFDETSTVSLPATIRTGVTSGTQVTFQQNHSALADGQRLEHYNFNDSLVGTMEFSNDVASPALGSTSLALSGNVRWRGYSTYVDANTNHLTIEAWLKWDDSVTSSDVRLGTGDRALRIVRDEVTPSNDSIGFQGSHSVWRPHPAFTSFAALAEPVMDNQWFHVAMVVHNAGMHEHSGHWHYEPGSFAMVFINGRLLGAGTPLDRIDISEDDEELVSHGSDRLALWQTAGTSRLLVDEFTVRQQDPTANGSMIIGLFDNGRGNTASAENWMLFE